MSVGLERLKVELLGLPTNDRLELARILWDSVEDEGEADGGAEAAWEAELDRRFADIESGQAIGIPAREAIESLRQKHR